MKRNNVKTGIHFQSVVPEAKGKNDPKMKYYIAHPKSDADMGELETLGIVLVNDNDSDDKPPKKSTKKTSK